MKLNDKGMDKFYDASILCAMGGDAWLDYDEIRKIKFEPEDFEGMVALTPNQAKFVLDALKYALDETKNLDDIGFYTKRICFLKERIKNSEK